MTCNLPYKTCTLLRIRVVLLILVLEAGPVYMAIALSKYFYILVAVLGLLCLFFLCFYIPRFVKSTEITVSNDGVVVKYGVFYKTEKIMPILRLIFMETYQTPLARLMGLCAVSFLGAKSRVTIPEISKTDAEKLFALVKGSKSGEQNG